MELAVPPPPPFERKHVYRGAALAVALQWSMRLIGLVSVLVLARILSPADFGIVGLATAASALVELFAVIGLRQALLRLPAPDRSHLDTAWTLQLILFGMLAMGLLALAPVAAWVYEEPRLTPVIAVLASRFLFLAVVNVGIVDFDRNLDFGRDLRMRIGARLAAFVVTIAAAVILRSYWALVIGLVVHSAAFTAASYVSHPYRPGFSLARRRELMGVSWWMFLNYAGQVMHHEIERLVVGRFAAIHLVGLYSVSKDLASIFTQEISTALNRVTFVTTARSGRRLAEDRGRIGATLGAYAMIAAPLGLGLAAASGPAVAVLLGDQWLAAAALLELIAPASALYAVYKVIAVSLQAGGHERLAASLTLSGTLALILAVATVVISGGGATAIATASLGVSASLLIAALVALARIAESTPLALGVHVARPFLAAGAMLLAVRLVPAAASAALSLAVQVSLGALVYGAGLAVMWLALGRPVGAETEALSVARSTLRGWFAKAVPSR